MKKSTKIYKKGFTLIEMIIAIALTTIAIIISVNMFFFGTNAHRITFDEYKIQSDVRIATEQVTNIVRYSKAVFGVPYPFVESTSKMDPGWSYFMVSSDGKRIVSMDYNNTTKIHEEKVVVEEQDDIEYEMIFEKDKNAKTDNVMIYKIYAYVIDESGNRVRDKIVFESTVESINAVQVADKGTAAAPSIALAYRNDGQTSGKGKNQIAYITIITDVSGSMASRPDGNSASDNSTDTTKHSRIKLVRGALAGTSDKEGIINFFSKEENIYLSLVPFSTTANTPTPTGNSQPNARHDIYEVFNKADKDAMLAQANALRADGGTNTGDALRQAYHLHNDFRTRMNIKQEDQVHHYTILLVDGETTYQTQLQEWMDDGRYYKEYIHESVYKRVLVQYWWGSRWEYRWVDEIVGEYDVWNQNAKKVSDLKDYTSSGNININMDFNYRFPNTVVNNPINNGVYGEKHANVQVVGISGNGRTTIPNASTIKTIGDLIKNFDDNNGVKSYLIGYAKGLTTEINYIGNSIGTETNNIYKYDDSSFNLDEIFKNIANDIMADFWLATGPQIQ